MSARDARCGRCWTAARCCARWLWVALAVVVLLVISDSVSAYNNLQLANGAYYFAVLAGLTMLAGQSGQISLGQGALMAVGAYTVALLIGNEGWALVPALVAAVVVTALVGVPVGRRRQPAARALPGGRDAGIRGRAAGAGRQVPDTFGGENGLTINPPIPPSWLGSNFPLERWEAWIACAGAVVVLFVLYNVLNSGLGQSVRAVRDDEIAASLCGLAWAACRRLPSSSAPACAGLAGGAAGRRPAAGRSPGAFPLQLSLSLLTGVVLGGLGSLVGRDLGSGAADAVAQLDQRPGALVLAVDPGRRPTSRWRSTASC